VCGLRTSTLADRDPQIFRGTDDWNRLRTGPVMYNVLSSLAACGRLGAAGVFVWQAASDTRPVARVARWRDASRLSQSSVSSGRRRTRLNLSVLARFS